MNPYELREHRWQIRKAALARGYTARAVAWSKGRSNPSFGSSCDDVILMSRIEDNTDRGFRVIPDPQIPEAGAN